MTRELTEKEFAAQLVQLATTLGWRRYHTWRSKHSAAGYPDETLVRDRLIFAECKRRGGKPTPEQVEWLTALARAGVETYLWVEDDLPEIAQVLSASWDFHPSLGWLESPGRKTLEPRSLWLPAGHRADHVTPARQLPLTAA